MNHESVSSSEKKCIIEKVIHIMQNCISWALGRLSTRRVIRELKLQKTLNFYCNQINDMDFQNQWVFCYYIYTSLDWEALFFTPILLFAITSLKSVSCSITFVKETSCITYLFARKLFQQFYLKSFRKTVQLAHKKLYFILQ